MFSTLRSFQRITYSQKVTHQKQSKLSVAFQRITYPLKKLIKSYKTFHLRLVENSLLNSISKHKIAFRLQTTTPNRISTLRSRQRRTK